MSREAFSARFRGDAALGAWASGDGFRIYTVKEFGFDSPSRFTASFEVWDALPPVSVEQVEAMLEEECEAYYHGVDAASRLEACERYDCSPQDLGRAFAEDLVADAGGDVIRAYCSLYGGDRKPFEAGEVRLELAGGGQADEFAKLTYLFADSGLVADVERLWHTNHLSDMHAGTPAQDKALADAGLSRADYDLRVKYLEEVGLLEDDWMDKKAYRYGTGWLDWGVSLGDAEAIEAAVAQLSALPGLESAAALYLEDHPDVFEG